MSLRFRFFYLFAVGDLELYCNKELGTVALHGAELFGRFYNILISG